MSLYPGTMPIVDTEQSVAGIRIWNRNNFAKLSDDSGHIRTKKLEKY